MITVPAATPPTTPVVLFTVAIAALLLLQVPPLTELVSAVLEPIQTVDEPLIVPAVAAEVIVTATVAIPVPHAVVTV